MKWKDIIPRYGFIHKPSPLWPISAIAERKATHSVVQGTQTDNAHETRSQMAEDVLQMHDVQQNMVSDEVGYSNVQLDQADYPERPVHVKMEHPDAVPIELRSQIHLYATNE